MKILHITPTLYPAVGGIETVVRELMRNLRRRGFESDAMHVAVGNTQTREELDGSTVWRMPLFPHRLIGIVPPMRKVLSQYDLLHVHDPHLMALSVNVLLQAGGKPVVLSTHGGYRHTSSHNSIKKLHWKFAAPLILGRYDEVLASSPSDWQIFKAKAPRSKLVPNGVSIEKFLSVDLNAATSPTRWVYWGRLSRNKRIDLLIDTVAQARRLGLLIDLLIIGRDFEGLLPSLVARVNEQALQAHIRFAGSLSDAELLKELATRSVFITASEHEGFGLSIVEAMAAGLVVICRDIPPLNTLVAPGDSGVLLNFDGGQSDMSSLKNLCDASPEEFKTMRTNARNAARPHSWERVISEYIEVYRALIPSSER